MGKRDVLTTWEAGRYCNLSPYTIRKWILSGELLAYVTPGGHRRIRRQDLDAFLQARNIPVAEDFREGRKRILVLGLPDLSGLAREAEGWCQDLEVKRAGSGFEAGVLLHVFSPHLLLVDLDDPRWDGLEVCRLVRSHALTSKIKLAGLTKHSTVEVLEAAQRAGVLACFSKPADPEEFRRFLKKLFPYCRWVSPRDAAGPEASSPR